MVEIIKDGEEVIAIIIRREFKKDGIEFFTENDFSQQLAYMRRNKGHVIDAHRHKLVVRKVSYTQEVLFIKSGRVRIDLYRNDKSFLKSVILETSDIILLASGGHGFEMLEDSEMIEVKQGPYISPEEDKERFDIDK